MYVYYFTFRSVTHAQRAVLALNAMGIPNDIVRTPKAIAIQGCGYSVTVRSGYYQRAQEEILKTMLPYQRIFCRLPGGGFEEVRA